MVQLLKAGFLMVGNYQGLQLVICVKGNIYTHNSLFVVEIYRWDAYMIPVINNKGPWLTTMPSMTFDFCCSFKVYISEFAQISDVHDNLV